MKPTIAILFFAGIYQCIVYKAYQKKIRVYSSNILVSKCRFLFPFEWYIRFLLNINNSFMIQLEIHWMENTFFSHSFVLLCLIKVAIVQCLWLNSDFLLLYQNYRSIECYCLSLYRKKMLVFKGRLYLYCTIKYYIEDSLIICHA